MEHVYRRMHPIQNADYPSEPPRALNMLFTYVIHSPLSTMLICTWTRSGALSTGNLTLRQ